MTGAPSREERSAPDLVTVGETMLRLSTRQGERLETVDALDINVGGAESNVAVAASRLGLDTAWLSSLPESLLADRITGELQRHGVDTRVARRPGRVGTYYLETGGEPRGSAVRYDRGEAPIRTATPDDLDAAVVDAATTLYTSGITPALSETLAETTEALLERARSADTGTAFDVNYRSKLWAPDAARETLRDLLPLVDDLIVAERDLKTVLGRDGAPDEAAADLASEYGHETVVVTRGDAGALAYHDGTVSERTSIPTDTVDPVGSGDAFVGGFLARRYRGAPVAEALDWGVAAAALCRTIAGDIAVISPAEIEEILAGETGGLAR